MFLRTSAFFVDWRFFLFIAHVHTQRACLFFHSSKQIVSSIVRTHDGVKPMAVKQRSSAQLFWQICEILRVLAVKGKNRWNPRGQLNMGSRTCADKLPIYFLLEGYTKTTVCNGPRSSAYVCENLADNGGQRRSIAVKCFFSQIWLPIQVHLLLGNPFRPVNNFWEAFSCFSTWAIPVKTPGKTRNHFATNFNQKWWFFMGGKKNIKNRK